MNRVLGLLSVLLVLSSSTSAQSWTINAEAKLNITGKQDFLPTKSIVAKVSDTEIKDILWSAPYEEDSRAVDSPARLKLLLADGSTMTFGIVRYDMQEPLLSAKFDHIRTFKGVSLTDRKVRARLDYTIHGLRAVINAPGKHMYIEYYKRGNREYKIIYDRKDYVSAEPFSCGVSGKDIEEADDLPLANARQGNCELNLLRLANAANIEYCDFHTTNGAIPDEDEVHSAVVTTINRVNEVYEQDFGVRMVLVNNNEDLYYVSGTDPYTNGNGVTMLSQNQTNIDNVIGNANYDIGHVFSTGGGGVATLSSVCNNGTKARGVTGQGSPIGDPFDIDYVAHEMGHQMNANHTQNNNCNRNSDTAMEPGSASTIMGYAGICAPNVQNNSDPYFHAISIQEVMNDASVFSCAEEVTNFGNTSPEVTIDASTYNIPKSTNFVLEANGADADNDDLTYCWEQFDDETANMPPASTNTGGPAFRSLEPVSDSKRYFPSLPDIIAGNSPTWEVLPSVSRDMNFRVTVRDWHDGPGTSDAGCTAEADVLVEVDGNSGPFVVTSQTTNVTWDAGGNETVTWDIANTDNAPINCTNVEIWFSEDDSFVAPTLISTTANNGSASILVPSIITTTGRIMVKGENNIFFDINEGEITIIQTDPTFEMSLSKDSDSYCNDVNTTSTNVITTSVLGYNTDILLSVSGLPSGATATFSQNPVTPGNSSLLTISNIAGEEGLYNIIIDGQSGAISNTESYDLTLSGSNPAAPISPLNGAEGVSLEPTLVWENLIATSFDYQFSTGPSPADIIQSGNVNNNQVNITTDLDEFTTYYWRVRANGGCSTAGWSDIYTFRTLSCLSFASNDLPVTLSPSGTNTATSDLTFYDRGTVGKLNVIDLIGTHSYMNDLNFTLIAPDNTSLEFWDEPCGSENNFDINFDDDANNNNFPCPPIDGNTYVPDNSLTAFESKDLSGLWQLEIFDDADQDGGELTSWGLKLCIENYCDLTVSNTDNSGLGSLNGALECAISGDTIRLMSDISGQTIDISKVISINPNVHILAERTENITLNFIGASNGFIVDTGVNTSFEGFNITSSGNVATIQNNGSLKLTDINITHPSNNQISNNANADIEINGQCNIQE